MRFWGDLRLAAFCIIKKSISLKFHCFPRRSTFMQFSSSYLLGNLRIISVLIVYGPLRTTLRNRLRRGRSYVQNLSIEISELCTLFKRIWPWTAPAKAVKYSILLALFLRSKLLKKRTIKEGVNQFLFGMRHTFRFCGISRIWMNIYVMQWLAVVKWWKSQCFIRPRQVVLLLFIE